MEEENEIEEFSDRDILLASVLLSLGFKHTGTDFQIEGERQNPIGYFKFEKTDELEEAVKAYRARELSIEPQLLWSNFRGIKSQLEGARKSPHSRFSKTI